MKVRVIIIEDERHACNQLRTILEHDHTDVEILGEATTTDEARELLKHDGIDGVFLDIELADGEHAGVDLAYDINALNPAPRIVFTTAYAQHAVTTHHLSSEGYLLKPLDKNEVANALDRIREYYLTRRDNSVIRFPFRHKVTGDSEWLTEYHDPSKDILFLETIKGTERVRVHCVECTDLMGVAGPLRDWERRLAQFDFRRIRRSTLLNWQFLHAVKRRRFGTNNYEVLLRNCPHKLPVGGEFLELFPGF